jgi:hypothetical protein
MPMLIEHRGYTIEVTAVRNDALWAANVSIEPANGGPTAWREKGEIDGAGSQSDAEAAGVQWGRYRIDLLFTD